MTSKKFTASKPGQTIASPLENRLTLSAVTLLLLMFQTGCERTQAQSPPPPPAVTVGLPVQKTVVEWDEYTGHLEAPQYVEVRARVSGLIVDVPFKEGSIVKKDSILFSIDPSPFQADLDSKKADVAKAQAQLGLANVQLERTAQELKTNAVSKSDYDNAAATVKQAQAVVASAKAGEETAQLNLNWCQVVAPITGRIGQKLVTAGNLIGGGSGQTTLLTTITSIDPIYCYVPVDERSVLKYARLAREKSRVSARDEPIPCYLQLENETGFPHVGVVDFVDNKVDVSTGTILSRGVFPNPGGYLTPGYFARVRVAGSGEYTALLVPDAAVGTDQNVKFLLLVNSEDVVERRPVKLGALFGELRAIESGLQPSDHVIIDGLLRSFPGAKVQPELKPIDPALFAPMVPATTQPAASQPAGTQPAPIALGVLTR